MSIRFGVLSTARIGKEQVIPAIHAASNAELVAIASRNEEKAVEFAKRNHIPKAYGSYEQLLQDPDIDAVYIPLPNHLHAEWAIKAAMAGKHILCEKPAALNAGQLAEVLEACKAQNVTFMEAFMYRFHPQWGRVKALIQSGEIGDVRVINSSFSFFLDNLKDIRMFPEMGGGALYDVGCYCVHAIRTLAGDVLPVKVEAVARFTNDVDTSLSAVLRFSNGIIGHFDCSFEVRERQYIQVAGTQGTLTLSYPFRPDLGVPTLEVTTPTKHTVECFEPFDMYVAEVQHFASCVASRQTPVNSPEESVRNLQIIDAIYETAGRGK